MGGITWGTEFFLGGRPSISHQDNTGEGAACPSAEPYADSHRALPGDWTVKWALRPEKLGTLLLEVHSGLEPPLYMVQTYHLQATTVPSSRDQKG